MKYINLVVTKNKTHKVNDASIRAQVWSACYDHLPVTFTHPEKVLKACKLEAVSFKDGTKAYRLRYPAFGMYHLTNWYK